MLNIALFGPPGAGKGTQAKKIVEKYNLAHLSTGDMIRKEIADGTDLGKMATGIINNGQLLSDDLVVSMIESCISKNKGVKGFLFDGFPRTVAQAEMLDKMLAGAGSPLRGLLNIDVPFEDVKKRLLERAKIEGRADDTEEVIEKRFKEYLNKTVHVGNYYHNKGLRFDIKGDGTVDEVFNSIVHILDGME